eukprot:Sspe_Gene.101985::Locus_76679_Transcript_1_1_Confidence_1.000_Length_1066::g.101985::m.101985
MDGKARKQQSIACPVVKYRKVELRKGLPYQPPPALAPRAPPRRKLKARPGGPTPTDFAKIARHAAAGRLPFVSHQKCREYSREKLLDGVSRILNLLPEGGDETHNLAARQCCQTNVFLEYLGWQQLQLILKSPPSKTVASADSFLMHKVWKEVRDAAVQSSTPSESGLMGSVLRPNPSLSEVNADRVTLRINTGVEMGEDGPKVLAVWTVVGGSTPVSFPQVTKCLTIGRTQRGSMGERRVDELCCSTLGERAGVEEEDIMTVSRNHARVYWHEEEGGEWVLLSDSLNTTKLNGIVVGHLPAILNHGDVCSFGKFHLRFDPAGDPPTVSQSQTTSV